MTVELTAEEAAFIVNVLGQLTVKASDPNAAGFVAAVQAITGKLAPPK